jgi:hypothetical protein
MSKGLEDFMKIVDTAHQKTASVKPSEMQNSVLQKLAAELEKGAEGATGSLPSSGATPAGSTLQQAPAAAAASEAVVTTQVALSGGNPAEQAAGEVPAQAKPNIGIIATDLAGTIVDPKNLNIQPAAIAAQQKTAALVATPVATPAVVATPIEKTAELQRAEEIGVAMAKAFIGGLEKEAADQEYNEAVEFLQSRGVLKNYNFAQ